MASIRQWDTDWFDQFKRILATNLTTLNIYPGTPLSWCRVVDVAYGQKQIQPQIRRPDQRVHVSKDVEYPYDKYADRIVQVADLPSITDSLRIDEEYYAGDPVNALGHVSDIGRNYLDGLRQYYIVGTAADALSYGLIDAGAGTGSTTVTRPDILTAVTASADWDTPSHILENLASMENSLSASGFHGYPRVIGTHPLLGAFLRNYVLTSTTTSYQTQLSSIGSYIVDFCEWYDSDATFDAIDVYMIDPQAFAIYQTPITARAHWNADTENYYWRWKTRGYLMSIPMHNGTDWQKGIVKCTVDIHD